MGIMNYAGGKVNMTGWRFGKSERSDASLAKLFAEVLTDDMKGAGFAILEFCDEKDPTRMEVSLNLASESDISEPEPTFYIHFDELIQDALEYAESKESFEARLQSLQAVIDKYKKISEEMG